MKDKLKYTIKCDKCYKYDIIMMTLEKINNNKCLCEE